MIAHNDYVVRVDHFSHLEQLELWEKQKKTQRTAKQWKEKMNSTRPNDGSRKHSRIIQLQQWDLQQKNKNQCFICSCAFHFPMSAVAQPLPITGHKKCIMRSCISTVWQKRLLHNKCLREKNETNSLHANYTTTSLSTSQQPPNHCMKRRGKKLKK